MSESRKRRHDLGAGAATLRIAVDGQAVDAVPGESVAAALTASGHRAFRKDGRDRRRGLLCGMGACYECRVSIDRGPSQRACLVPVRAGMEIETLSQRERIPSAATKDLSRETLESDALVIGAGPAGATVALRLAETGRRVTVVDERHDAGGQFYKQTIAAQQAAGRDDAQYRDGRALIGRLRESGATLITGATVWGAFRDSDGRLEIAATTSERSLTLRAATLIVATGAHESVPPFAGWTLPGVMTTGAAQSLLRAYRVSPGDRVLIAGNGPLNLQLACELLDSGVRVVAVAESAPPPSAHHIGAALAMLAGSPSLTRKGLRYLSRLRHHGVPLYYAHHILRAEGDESVERGFIAPIDAQGQLSSQAARQFDVDAICLGYRQRPSAEIVRALGCRMTKAADGIDIPERSRNGATSIPGVYAIGDGALPRGAHVAMAEAELAFAAITAPAGRAGDQGRLRRHERFQRGLWSLYAAAEPNMIDSEVIVCRCESVTAGTIRHHLTNGVQGLDELKRRTRAGMGPCQGRYCQRPLARLCAETSIGAAAQAATFFARNPITPVTVADIADEMPEWRGYRPAAASLRPQPETRAAAKIDEADVLIVGAGVIGIAAALYLARSGVDVLLIERGQPNGEASGGNAGSLHLQLLPFDFYEDAASPAVEALPLQASGIGLWEQLADELEVDFELSRDGGLMLADNDADLDFLRNKAALEKQYGVEAELLTAAETRALLPAVAGHVAGAAFCAGEGKINPLLATPALLSAATRAGARLRTGVSVTDIENTGSGYRVTTSAGAIACRRLINAAGGWSADIAGMLDVTLPIQSAPQQMLVTQPVDLELPFLLSVAKRHLTMKKAASGNLLIGGGWPAAYDDSGRSVIRRDSVAGNLWVACRVLPAVAGLKVIRGWGATGVMIDGKPVVGESAAHAGFFTAVGANGYTMAPILGRIVADLVQTGGCNVDLEPFSPERFGRATDPDDRSTQQE